MIDKVKVIISVVCTIATFLLGAYLNGARWEKKFLKLEKESAETLAKQQEEAREKYQSLMETHAKLKTDFEKERKQADEKIRSLRNSINDGSTRLYVNAKSVSGCTPVGDSKTRCELDAATAQSLIDITADGDDAIRELNLCIDKYNALRPPLAVK